MLYRECFNANDLELVPRTDKEVVLNSGGPIMQVLSVAGDVALCEWEDGRGRFHIDTLSRLIPFRQGG